MSIDKAPATALVRLKDRPPDPSQVPHHANLEGDSAIPLRSVDVVTAEEQRYEEQLRHKVRLNPDFVRDRPVPPPLAPGATVRCETLVGFLAAIEAILPPDTNYPILSSAKLVYEQDADRLYLEAGSHAVWTLVALKAEPTPGNVGYEVVIPVQRSRNILSALCDMYPSIVVGVDEHGVCLGPNTVSFGGPIDDFPVQPVIGDWLARAAMPSTCFREICSSVMSARSDDFTNPALHGVLLDFEHHTIDGASRVLCTAVATDGARIHILRLPQMVIEVKATHLRALPPTITVPGGFFQYMREIIQNEWAAVEFGIDQLVAKGPDYVVVAKAAASARSSFQELENWRKVNAEWPGYWLVSGEKLLKICQAATHDDVADEMKMVIDGRRETLTISSSTPGGDRFTESMPARCFDGPPVVNVHLSIRYVMDALEACRGGLVRLAFTRDLKDQSTSPIVIRGESEQFKAIIMPRLPE